MADAGSFNADLGINMQFNIDGAGLAEITKTIKEISKGKDLQRYWKDVESATDSASKAIERYSKNVNSKGLAENLLKQINALKAITKNENLSELFPNIELNLDELVESAKKIVPKINSEFSVDSFSQAFKTFDLLKEKALDLREVFNMLANYSDLVSRNSELSRENSQFRELIGDSDVEEVKSKLSEIKRLRDQAEEIFTSFLKVNNVERTDYWGDEKFSDYFDAIRKGSLTATKAISRFKTEYAYLLEEGFKSNNDTFGLEQLQAFSNKLDSIFRQVEETSTKINDIISNGVIAKSVENLSMDSSLSDSQRSLFGNLLEDEESLKSITALFQKLIEESNKTSKVDLFNDEQLQQVLSIFDKMEKHLSSLRSIISDVGDGEEFSPLLKMINNVQSSISELATSVKGIGLNMNIDVGSDSEMEAKVQSKIANALQAYQRLFDAIKMSGAGGSVINTNFFEFDINQYDTMMSKIQAYKKFIDNMRTEAKAQFNGKDILYQSVDKKYWTQASAAFGQVTKAFNEMNTASDTNPLKDLFGSGDLSDVVSQLGLIVAKLEEISTTASSFKEVFTNGFNVTASVEEIDKLTNRVKELEEELSKVKLNPVSVDKSNISSENPTVEVSQNDEVTASIRKKKEELASYELQLEETRYEIEKLSKAENESFGFNRSHTKKEQISSLRDSVTRNIFGKLDNGGRSGQKKWFALGDISNIDSSVLKSYQMWNEELSKAGYKLSEIRAIGKDGLEADIIPIDGKAITNAEEFRKALDNITTAPSENVELLNKQVSELESKISSLKAEIASLQSNQNSPMKDVFQGSSSSAEKLEQDIKNIESATDRAAESAKEYRKILSQVGEFDIDSKVSAMYKRNDGQLESWTWRAKKDDEGNVLYNQDGQIDYDEPTVTVISKYEQLEKIIVKADNELRNLQKDLAEIKAYDSTASTTNIEAKISDQKEYIRLLEQTVKVISQSDEYLLDEQQIIDARNKAAREYALTMGSKQEKTDAKQSASDEKKRLANIEQVNRALNKQQITIDAIEKTYNKSTNPDLDREVSNQQDLAELAQKKLDIQTKINSLQGQERNSANEKEFLELEKLIAEYKELAKYKLKANNPSKQELGGQNLQTLIQVQISNYDKLITKAEKYGDSTSDTVEKLKEQRDILSKIGADGKYSASADQYYASRDTYKVESAALSAFEAETKAAEQEAKVVQKLAEEKRKLRQQGKQSTQSSVDKALTDQVSAWKQIQSIREKIAKTDNADEINALQESKKYYQEQYNNANKILKANDDLYDKESQIARLEQIRLETNAKIARYKKNTSLSSIESSLKSYQKQLSDLSIKPDDAHRFPEYQAQLDSLNKAIQEYRTFVDSLQGKGIIDESDITESDRLKANIEKLLKETKTFSSGDRGYTELGADKVLEKINSILEQNSAMSKKAKAQIKAYYNEILSGNPTRPLNEILDDVYKIVQAEREAGRAGQSWLEIFNTKKLHSFLGQAASMFSFYDLVNVGREIVTNIKEVDTALTELRKVSDATEQRLTTNFKNSADTAKELGATISDVISATADWSRMGYNIDQAEELARVSTLYKNVGDGIDIETANNSLISTLQGFQLDTSEAESIIDKFNEVANNYAIDSAGIGEALQRSAASFNAANTDLSKSIALITATNEVVQDPDSVGKYICLPIQ